MRAGENLKRKIALAASLVAPAAEAFWTHRQMRALFPQFLVAIYGSVRATIPLMKNAMIEAERHGTDPVCAELLEYFRRHIAEELNHDEWLLNDLEVLGVSRLEVRSRLPNRAIAAMVGAQYYWIMHVHPVALLGFFAVLEGHPPEVDQLCEIERRTGLPTDAFRMLKYHAEVDQTHADELYTLLDRLPLEQSQVELVDMSALNTLAMLKIFFESLCLSIQSRSC